MPDVGVHVAEPVHPGDVPGVDRGPGDALTRQTVADLISSHGFYRHFFNEERNKRGKTKLTTPLTPQWAAQMNSKRLSLLSSHSPFKLRKASFITLVLL